MADMASEAEARYDRRFAIEHIDPTSVRTAKQPCLAITGAAAQHLRAADDEPVAAGDREPAPAQLRLPGLGRVEACLLDLIQNLLDLGGREFGRGDAVPLGEWRYRREIEIPRERATTQ